MKDIKKTFKLLRLGICVWIVWFLITDLPMVKKEAAECLWVWVNIIIPSVFPYLILSQYISSSDVLAVFERFPGKLLCSFLGVSKECTRALIASAVCGYPSGAVCAAEMKKAGIISDTEAQRLIQFTNNAGPLFVISAVGSGMLGSAKDGFAIYVIEIVAAFLYGIISRRKTEKTSYVKIQDKKECFDFCEAVKKAVTTSVNICGYMLCAYIMAAFVQDILKKINLPFLPDEYTKVITGAVFEISSGVRKLSAYGKTAVGFGLICGAVSWSGLSVIMQIKSVSGNMTGLGKIIKAKLCQALFGFAFGYIYRVCICEYEYKSFQNYGIVISLSASIILFLVYFILQKWNVKKVQNVKSRS